MRRVAILAALLTTGAVDTSVPSENAALILNTGDVLCVGYEATSSTCLVKTTVSRSDETGIAMLEQMILIDFGAPLKITTLTTHRRVGMKYCLSRGNSRTVVVPEIHDAAALLTLETVRGLNRYAQADYCVEHRSCGKAHVAIATAGKERFPAEDTIYTLFQKDDPRTDAIGTREMQIAELDPIKGFAPVSCLPSP